MEETINWLDSGIVCAARQERRKEGMPPGMFGSLKIFSIVAGGRYSLLGLRFLTITGFVFVSVL